MHKLELRKLLLACAVFLAGSPSNAQPETIFSTGIGDTVQAAMQNAAANALTQAVGQFIDVQTQMTRISEIRDGVSSMVSAVTEDVRVFSNGSIRSIDIFEQRVENGLYVVSAAVVVELRDLQAQINPILSTEAAIDQGIFASIMTDYENNSSRSEVLERLVLRPIFNLDGASFSVGQADRMINAFGTSNLERPFSDMEHFSNPSLISRIRQAQYMANSANDAERYQLQGYYLDYVTGYTSTAELNSWIQQIEISGIGMLYLPITASINEATASELRANLNEISTEVARITIADAMRYNGDGLTNQIFNLFNPQTNSNVIENASALVCLLDVALAECYLATGLDFSNSDTPLLQLLKDAPDNASSYYPRATASVFSGAALLTREEINGYFDNTEGGQNPVQASFRDLLNRRPASSIVDYSRYFSPYSVQRLNGRGFPIIFLDLESTLYLGLNFDLNTLRSINRISLDVAPAAAFDPHLDN